MYPFAGTLKNNYPRNYNNLDRPRYAIGGSVREPVMNMRPLQKFEDVPDALSSMQYGYGGGIYNRPVTFPVPNNGRTMQQVNALDVSNYYNSRK